MKFLIVYYSRTGTTKKVAEQIAHRLGAKSEEIIDLKKRKGPIGYIVAGKDATQKKHTKLGPYNKNPKDYDVIIIGTPIWAWTITPAVRTYLHDHKNVLKNKSLAFFCTMGGSGDKNAFEEMQKLSGVKPKATLALLSRDVWGNNYEQKIIGFIKKL